MLKNLNLLSCESQKGLFIQLARLNNYMTITYVTYLFNTSPRLFIYKNESAVSKKRQYVLKCIPKLANTRNKLIVLNYTSCSSYPNAPNSSNND